MADTSAAAAGSASVLRELHGSPTASQDQEDEIANAQVSIILRSLNGDEIDMLRDAFIYMDRDSDGFVGFDELMVTVLSSVGEDRFGPLRTYLEPIFLVADKDGDGKLSLTEFLLSYADGPGVVPAEVVNSCVASIRVRLSDEEITALQESFRRIDANEDGFIDRDELIVALREVLLPKFPDLDDGSFEEIVSVVMTSADADRDGKLCLSEFIRSYQEDHGVLPSAFIDVRASQEAVARALSQEELNVLTEAFTTLDKDCDGYISYSDLHQVLWDSLATATKDKGYISELCDLIIVTADRNRKGSLSLADFVHGFVRNLEVMRIAVSVAEDAIRKGCDKLLAMQESGELQKLVMIFDDLDKDKDGYVNQAELVGILCNLFRELFPEWDEETLRSVMNAVVVSADMDRDGRLSLDDFVRSFADGGGVLPQEAVRAWKTAENDEVTAAQQENVPAGEEERASVAAHTDNVVPPSDEERAVRHGVAAEERSGAAEAKVLAAAAAETSEHQSDANALQAPDRQPADGSTAPSLRKCSEEKSSGLKMLTTAGYRHSSQAPQRVGSPYTSRIIGKRGSTNVVVDRSRRAGSVSDLLTNVPRTTTMSLRELDWGYFLADELRREFALFDVNNEGSISRSEFKKAYLQMENFGLEPTAQEVDHLFSKYGTGDTIGFNEFCVIMLQRERM